MGRGLIVVLIASIAANVFLGGFVVGRLMGDPHSPKVTHAHEKHRAGLPRGMGRNIEKLSPEGRIAVRELYNGKRQEMHSTRRDIRELRRELAILLQAEEWDKEAVVAVMNELAEKEQEHRNENNKLVLSTFELLDLEDRQVLAKKSHGRSHHPEGGKKH